MRPVWPALAVALLSIAPASAQVLSGQISSSEEGAMEGVVVSARKVGATTTISVVSDADGKFSFPPAKIESGRYNLRIRAVGFELDGPRSVEVGADTASIALTLKKTDNLAAQLTSSEWFMSFPGTREQKNFLDRCTSCHTYERIAKSSYNADEFIPVLQRMGRYAPGSTPVEPHLRKDARAILDAGRLRPRAEFLANINLSQSASWRYPLRSFPRLTGRSTKVVVTEYALPRPTAMPHDVILDGDGMAWYTDFGHQFLGRLDPKTGDVTDFPVPTLKPDHPPGMLDIEIDKKGDLWLGLMLQGGIAKFDRKAETFTMFPLPAAINNSAAQQAMVMPLQQEVDGKVWMNSVALPGLHRLDLATMTFETFAPFKDMPRAGAERSVYGIQADSSNNLYFMDFGSEYIGRIGAKTKKASFFRTPTAHSNPRRGYMDAQDRLWFAEYRADKLAMFDTRSERFTEWPAPPFSWPYDVIPDKNGELWTAGMSDDRVTRFDPKTGRTTQYQFPSSTNARRVWIDNTTTPVTFWVGGNHTASIVKVEPLD